MNPSVVILGSNTFLGSHLVSSLARVGMEPFAWKTDEAIDCQSLPRQCSAVFFCHDASRDRDGHLSALTRLCEVCLAKIKKETGGVLRIAYFSGIEAFAPSTRPIREDRALPTPHNLFELTQLQAELALRAWSALSDGAIQPLILRHGEIFGDEPLFGTKAGHLLQSLARALKGLALDQRGLATQLRTITHIDDLTDAAVSLLKADGLPVVVNLPGKKMAVNDYLETIARKYDVEITCNATKGQTDEIPVAPGNRVLSATLFHSLSDYRSTRTRL